MGDARLPRAVRNKSPGNLRPRTSQPPWPGQSGIDDADPDPPYSQFVTTVDGFAALVLWLLDANLNRGLATVTALINVYAPPSDDNPTSSYSAFVEKGIGHDALDLMPNGKADVVTLTKLCQAISRWESATQWSSEEMASGVQLGVMRWPEFNVARHGATTEAAKPPPPTS